VLERMGLRVEREVHLCTGGGLGDNVGPARVLVIIVLLRDSNRPVRHVAESVLV
jgi:hypothetical protein